MNKHNKCKDFSVGDRMIKKCITLFMIFFYIGLFTIGGGYAMLPLLEKEVVFRHKWLNHEELLDVFALGQSTPGIIALNVSTFVGVKQCGIIGGIFATAGMIMPSLIIISILASFISSINQYPLIVSIFAGIRAVVAGLLICTVYKLGKRSVRSSFAAVILILSFVLITFFAVSPIIIVIGSGLAGVGIYVLGVYKERKR